MQTTGPPRFDVHPSVVFQLGESLISDPVQALIELVKNSYDADATYAKVIIDTQGALSLPGTIFPPHGGRIIVEDDGLGMKRSDIESGWLLISNRKKRKLKQQKKTTPGGRTPLGDKGLGRLGVQRLGQDLEVFTKTEEEPAYHFGFSWLDFETAPSLQDVDIHFNEVATDISRGTRVVVSELRELDFWRGQSAVSRLQQNLSRMLSPYKQIRQFFVSVEVDGKALELREVSDKVRDMAPVRYSIEFDGAVLQVVGRARLDLFRPPEDNEEAEQFALLAESDNGDAFFDFLCSRNQARSISLCRSESDRWFVEYKFRKPLLDVDKVERDSTTTDGEIANPGSFRGEVDSFSLSRAAFGQQSIFDLLSEFRDHIKALSGIRVYRDGFAVPVDSDWLNLAGSWTSGTSYYGLKPDNTLGYIALSARHNMQLEETTDREGFKETPHYRNFYALLEEFKGFTVQAHTFFRRSWNEFRKKRKEELADVDSRKTVEEISGTISRELSWASKHQREVESLRKHLVKTASTTRRVSNRVSSATKMTTRLKEEIGEAIFAVERALGEAQGTMAQLSSYLDQLVYHQKWSEVLQDRVDGLRRQMDDMYETVALGLTAEALSHEVFNVADLLGQKAKSVQAKLRGGDVSASTVRVFVEHVHSSVAALRKQMSYLSPSLKYVRERKQDIDVVNFLGELVDFYTQRLSKNEISICVRAAPNENVGIRMNRGKLSQIFDNLILNAEYWLQEDISQARASSGTIVLEIKRPFVRVFDSGRGIDPAVEHSLFEPFISAKAKGKGRGLGLFIVKQLLDSEGCSVGILPERNDDSRLYKFQIDFRGALHE